MPARKGWIEAGAEYFFWALSDAFPEFRHRLRYEIMAHNGRIHMYFTLVSPTAALECVNLEFFTRFNVPSLSWEPVVRVGGRWEPLESFTEEKRRGMTMVDFGWRHRESILMEAHPPFLVEPHRGDGTLHVAEEPPFLRKLRAMGNPGGADVPHKATVNPDAPSFSNPPTLLKKRAD